MDGKTKCPMCNGCGEIKQPHFQQKIMKEKSLMAQRMREQGYSIREIMKTMGYKSPKSVMDLLKRIKDLHDGVKELNQPHVSGLLPNDNDKAWNTHDVIAKLVEATDILLHRKDYDGHGWEEIEICYQRGKEILQQIKR